MATFVLVPGAWLGGWVWEPTARRLRQRGHDVHPVTLTGLGERARLGGPDADRRWLRVHATDHPFGTYTQPLRLRNAPAQPLPTVFPYTSLHHAQIAVQ